MKKVIVGVFSLSIVFILIFSSCKKTINDSVDADDMLTVSDNSSTQGVYDDVFKISEYAMSNPSVAGGNLRTSSINAGDLSDCAAISVQDTSNILTTKTRVIVIDFNANGSKCINYDGKARSGKIIISINNPSASSSNEVKYNSANAVTTITFDNYVIDTNQVFGQEVITCITPGTHTIVLSSADGSGYANVIYAIGFTSQLKSTRTRTLYSGGGDNNIYNNIFDFTGTSEGISLKGTHYTASIQTAVRLDYNCIITNGSGRFPISGTIGITPDNKAARTVAYDTNPITDPQPAPPCDNYAYVIVNSVGQLFAMSY